MSILPSPPHISFSPEPAFAHHHHHHHHHRQPDSSMKTVLAASWRSWNRSPPPPTLREILEAYKARGDGDREMLLAMLNAKSSEDQRLASFATLHRAMLDMYQAPHPQPVQPVIPLHIPDAPASHHYAHAHHFPSPPASYHHSPHAHIPQQLHHDQSHQARHRTDSVSSMNESRERTMLSPSTSEQPRKRRRTSRSPPSQYETRMHASSSQDGASAPDLPPSPYSSASSAQSSGGSPRSRESMAINSLLLNSHADRADETPKRNTSCERSTTTVAAAASRDR
ncbi:hypothetical protein BC628DRAFT_1316781 [Trametes gibbosa]|nr:hypothetical protein BC628DRAFT_1411853 [Trametes gibbosa]KAI0828320.1 hypothetical protein BC628DRAFT_1316781 [Trametes gibbosa]